MEKQLEIIQNNVNTIKDENSTNKHYFTTNNKFNNKNELLLSSKMIQVDLPPYKTLATIKNKELKSFSKTKYSNKKGGLINKDILNLKRTFNNNKPINLLITNDNTTNKFIIQNNKKNKSNSKESDDNNKKIKNNNSKLNKDKLNVNNKNNTINNKFPKTLFSQKNRHNGRNKIPNIIQSSLEIASLGYSDRSLQNFNELKHTFNAHMKNKEIFKKQHLDKNNFDYNSYRKYYFGKKSVDGLPYYYDITSTYMNMYENKSEQNRHEVLIKELCKLRAYLFKYKIENSTEVIKDFLIKHNIPDIQKYSNYQLMQFGRFVCQDDTYKMNSLLKPYMNVKDMINDILKNSENLNEKFSPLKFNPSLNNFFSDLKTTKSQPFLQRQLKKISSKKIFKPGMKRNKKFYISELDYSGNKSERKNQFTNNISKNDYELNEKKINDKKININDEEKNNIEKNGKAFNIHNLKKNDNINKIGIEKKYVFGHFDNKESYFSPLIKINNFQKKYINHNKKIKLPKIANNISTIYKPNKILLSQEKNYSLNFGQLLKDVVKDVNIFQKDYEKKFDVEIQSYIGKNLPQSKSCENINNYNETLKKKKLEENNRLFFGKKTIKADLGEIQKKHKLTEYIALLNAKNHIKNEIINNNVINY